MSSTANSWLIYHLTGSKLLLGVSAFAAQVPAFVLAPAAGVLVDRWDLRRTLVFTQCLSLLQSLSLAGLCYWAVMSDRAMVAAIMALQLAQGVINAFDIPARQSFGIQMVDRREDLQNAIALNSLMVNLSRVVGPAVAGLLIAVGVKMAEGSPRAGEYGAALCYAVDAVSYVGVIWALTLMRPRQIARAVAGSKFVAAFWEGLSYVWHEPALRTALGMLCVSSFFGVSVNSQLASIATSVLGVGPEGFGMLLGGVGVGATVGAVFLATRKSISGLPRAISICQVVFGCVLVAVSQTRVFWLAVVLTPVLGCAMVVQAAGTNTLLQTLAPDDKRGRVMSFFTMSFMGLVPMGALGLGAAAEWAGASAAVLVFGAVVLAVGLVAGPVLRRVRVEPRGMVV